MDIHIAMQGSAHLYNVYSENELNITITKR